MNPKEQILSFIEAKRDLFIRTSDKLWEFAETRFEEYQSADLLCGILSEEGFVVTRDIPDMETAFVATYGTGGPVIGILAEYDALYGLSQEAGIAEQKPLIKGGKGHGCGHHALGASALAAAIGAKDYLKAKRIPGTIILFGCPAEEGGSGKVYMIRAGCFNNVDVALSPHPGSENSVTTYNMLATISAYFKFHGTSSHAAASPHLGRSALDAIELMNVGANFLREHVIQSARIHYAITDSGGLSPNVVQSDASVLYQIRAPELRQAREIYERIVKVAQGAALMTETDLKITYDRATSEPFHCRELESLLHAKMTELGPVSIDENDRHFAQQIRKTLTKADFDSTERTLIELYGDAGEKMAESIRDKAIVDCIFPFTPTHAILPASSDFGDVSWIVPTVQFMTVAFAHDTPFHSWQAVAQGKSALCRKSVLKAGEIMALTAAELFEVPSLVEKIKEEFHSRLGGRSYVCPIPPDVKPSPRR